ncbi:MAG: helicase C-terminal domain-containing protein [Parcubacteria group bacterium]
MAISDKKTLEVSFPFAEKRPQQNQMIDPFSQYNSVILEGPPGTGKTVAGVTGLLACQANSLGPNFYTTPTKQLVGQLVAMHPQLEPLTGRSDNPCLYYEDRGVPNIDAQESPCYSLDCPHRVDQETGMTQEPGVTPCAYLWNKFRLRREAEAAKAIIGCTTAFFLMNRTFDHRWRALDPSLVVVDEVHQLASIARRIFEYTVTDFHLTKCAYVLRQFDRKQAKLLNEFRRLLVQICRRHPSSKPALVQDTEVEIMIAMLAKFDADKIEGHVRSAIASGKLDPVGDRETIKTLENLTRGIPRMIKSLEFSLENEIYNPLNYVVCSYFQKNDVGFKGTKKKARYFLVIKPYYVAPLIKKAVGKKFIAYSATVGDPAILGYETGLKGHFVQLGSPFPSENTRVYLLRDGPNTSDKLPDKRKWAVHKALRMIAKAAKEMGEAGNRSLVVVQSETERKFFMEHAARDIELDAITYGALGEGVPARQVAEQFKSGFGTVLIGTSAQYGQGVDLPRQIAPCIFFLRPGYPPLDSPEAQFEVRRFSKNGAWARWQWRAMNEALQVRGRNIRSGEDLGVTIFVSRVFHRFLLGALPEWLKPSYMFPLRSMDEAVTETIKMLKAK